MIPHKTILIVDDEPMLREAAASYLEQKGFRVLTAETGSQALTMFERETIHFVVLDLMLPDVSGEDVCVQLRKRSRVPILMLTAKTAEEDQLNGLRLGADDYLPKPFSLKVLHAHIEAILRRSQDELTPLVERFSWNGGDLCVDFGKQEVRKQGQIVSLTPNEWKLLTTLSNSPKRVFTRDELIEYAFGDDFDGYDRVIDTHIKNLRKKIEDDPRNPVYVRTVRGTGYRFGGDAT
ncbi:MAG: response regulator transcription factor [Faecousia sp.]